MDKIPTSYFALENEYTYNASQLISYTQEKKTGSYCRNETRVGTVKLTDTHNFLVLLS